MQNTSDKVLVGNALQYDFDVTLEETRLGEELGFLCEWFRVARTSGTTHHWTLKMTKNRTRYHENIFYCVL